MKKNKKILYKSTLALSIILSITSANADRYNMVIIKEKNNYDIGFTFTLDKLKKEYTSWINNGGSYDCDVWMPLQESFNEDSSFIQNRTCNQDQIRKEINYYYNEENKKIIYSEINENQTATINESQNVMGTNPIRNMCVNILNNGKSIGNGIYDVYYDVNNTASFKKAYCDMSGGGWTLYDSFGTKLVKTNNNNPKAYNYDNINDFESLNNSGYNTNIGTINENYYNVSPYYLQWYLPGEAVGYIKKIMPDWINSVKVSMTNEWYNGNNKIRYGTELYNIIENQGYTEYIFNNGGKELYMDEFGIFWIDSVWIK